MIRIPEEVTLNETLSIPAKFFYGLIMSECELTDYCMTTNQEFADLGGRSTRSVGTWLKDLTDAGYIKITTSNDRNLKISLGRCSTIRIITPLIHDRQTDDAVSWARNCKRAEDAMHAEYGRG